MSRSIGWHVWSITWGNPYTTPPDDQPRTLIERAYPEGHEYFRTCPPEIQEIHKIGDGYSVSFADLPEPTRRLSPSVLASVRIKRITRRLQKKYPLFWESFLSDDIAKNPTYYQGITNPGIEADRVRVEDDYKTRRDRLINEFNERKSK